MKKQENANPYYKTLLKEVNCSKCGRKMKISFDSVSGICWRCVCDMTTKIEQ